MYKGVPAIVADVVTLTRSDMIKFRSTRRPQRRLTKKKAGPLRVRFQFAGAGASNHLPEGNSCRRSDCHLGEEQPLADNESQYDDAPILRNAKARMPAMQCSHGPACALTGSRFGTEKRKSTPHQARGKLLLEKVRNA